MPRTSLAIAAVIVAILLAFASGGTAAGMVQSQATPSIEQPRDTVIARVTTLAHADQQYSLYLPPGYDTRQRWPVLVILDARGRAEATAQLAMPGARRHGWIVLSSYQSRSDVDETGTLLALQALLREVGVRYAYDPRRVYLAGFSGTAKTLWTRIGALREFVAGMIGCGGGPPPELGPLRQPPAAFFGCAGREDFNYQEMRDLDDELARLGVARRLLLFDGPHGWPDADGFATALGWFDLVAMHDGRMPRSEDRIDAAFADARADATAAPDALERARRLDQAVRDFQGLRDTAALQAEAVRLRDSAEARGQLAQQRRLRSEERRATQQLEEWSARVSRRRDEDGREIDPPMTMEALRQLRVASLKRMATDADAEQAASARRRLERIHIATSFYLPERFARQADWPRATAMLSIAIAIAPDRGATHWRLARIHAQAGKVDDAFTELQRSRALGYDDPDDLHDNAAWARLRTDPRWPAQAPGD